MAILIFYIIIFGFLGSFILGCLGFITGMWAEKFDHTATVTNFILQPLSFLSGVFYTIDRLPEFFQSIAYALPLVYIFEEARNILVNNIFDYKNIINAFCLIN